MDMGHSIFLSHHKQEPDQGFALLLQQGGPTTSAHTAGGG